MPVKVSLAWRSRLSGRSGQDPRRKASALMEAASASAKNYGKIVQSTIRR
jgi:hypothetical protein